MDLQPEEDPAIERWLGRLMLAGVYGCTLCLFGGLVLWLVHHDSAPATVLLKTGLLALMAAPALRVLISAVSAIRQKDWLHLATILTVGLLLGAAIAVASRG